MTITAGSGPTHPGSPRPGNPPPPPRPAVASHPLPDPPPPVPGPPRPRVSITDLTADGLVDISRPLAYSGGQYWIDDEAGVA